MTAALIAAASATGVPSWATTEAPQAPRAASSDVAMPNEFDDRIADDPQRAAQVLAEAAADAERRGDARAAFWAWLAVNRAHSILERPEQAEVAVGRAARVLERLPEPRGGLYGWLELGRLFAERIVAPVPKLVERAERLKRGADERLRCDILILDLWLLSEAGLTDDAWVAAEQAESCANRTGSWHRLVYARMWMGLYAARLGRPDAEMHLRRAREALEGRPARYLTSLVEYELGYALIDLGRPAQAPPHFELAANLSRSIGDALGEVAALGGQARALQAIGRHAQAVQLARRGLALVDAAASERDRVPLLRSILIQSLRELRHPDLAREIAAALAEPLDRMEPFSRGALYDEIAAGLAALGRGDEAYRMLRRAREGADDDDRNRRDAMTLRLQARYENALRDAENAELRLRTETARLELEARRSNERSLWAGLVALALALSVSAGVAWHAVARRRQLADLALRDDLTGTLNRRAVMAYGQAQLQLARRMELPLTLMMVDLDHFKALNDRYGHAVGDAALRAFAAASRSTLRGQDQFGRIGGEEWVYVLPGTRLPELTAVFDRLRARFAAEPIAGLPLPHGITFSAGGTELTPGRDDLEALLAQADQALYRAKRGGRDRLEFDGSS